MDQVDIWRMFDGLDQTGEGELTRQQLRGRLSDFEYNLDDQTIERIQCALEVNEEGKLTRELWARGFHKIARQLGLQGVPDCASFYAENVLRRCGVQPEPQEAREVTAGVSMGFLQRLLGALEATHFKTHADFTTHDVVREVIGPAVARHECALLDLLRAADVVEKPAAFVSHPWKGSFRDLVQNLHLHLLTDPAADPESIGVWVDIFSIAQHPGREGSDEDLRRVQACIQHCGRTCVHVDAAGTTLQRIWCLFECWITAKANLPLEVMAYRVPWVNLRAAYLGVDIEHAAAAEDEDRFRVLSALHRAVNLAVFDKGLQAALMHATTDQARQGRLRFGHHLHPRVAWAMATDAEMQRQSGNFKEALTWHKRALGMMEALRFPDRQGSVMEAASLNAVGACLSELRRPGEAQAPLRRALAILTRALRMAAAAAEAPSGHASASEDPEEPDEYFPPGYVPDYRHHNQNTQSPRRKKAAKKKPSPLTPAPPSVPSTPSAGQFRRSTQASHSFSSSAPPDYEQLAASDGVLGPHYMACLMNLGTCYKGMGELDEAVEMMDAAVRVARALLPHTQPFQLAQFLSNQAGIYNLVGRRAQGYAMLREGLAIYAEHDALDLVDAASMMSNLAMMLHDDGRGVPEAQEECKAMLERALAIFQRDCGADSLPVGDTLYSLAMVAKVQRQVDAAEDMLRQALRIHERVCGRDDVAVARDVSALAQMKFFQGKLDEAIVHMQRGVKIYEKQYDMDHPLVQMNLDALMMIREARDSFLGRSPRGSRHS